MAFKIVLSDPKTGKSYKVETEDQSLVGMRIGEAFPGESLGLAGYRLEITGGSDKTGTPMRKEVDGSGARRLLLSNGVGFHAKKPGQREKKRIFGNKVGADIVQINMKVAKEGAQPLASILGPKEEKKTEEKPAEKKTEEKPAEKTGEKPAEEKK